MEFNENFPPFFLSDPDPLDLYFGILYANAIEGDGFENWDYIFN